METNKRNYILYLHLNKIDGKRYYGITSQKPEYRWNNGKGYKKNKYFTNAINKHGWDNFEHIILFQNLTKEEAEELEILHIAEYKTRNKKYGYNIREGGKCGTHSEESKKKISESKTGENHPMYGKHHTEEWKQKMSGKNNPKAKSVICITTRKIFFAVKEGANYYNIANSANITSCCKGRQKSCGTHNGQKLVWRYVNWNHNFTYRIKRTMIP